MPAASDLDSQMNPRVAVPDFQVYLDAAAERSAAARLALPRELDVRYGTGPLQTLDIFTSEGQDLPVHVFIHGGFWRGLDKNIYSEIARPIVEAGAIAILVNYDLCPSVTLDEIVSEIRVCVSWLYHNVSRFGGDRDRISLSGHSAGAHLAATALCHDWTINGLPADAIKAAVLVSGVYDLRPVPQLAVNEEIGLSDDMARRHSVMFLPTDVRCPALVAVGAEEPRLWKLQSVDYARTLLRCGVPTRYLEIIGDHHFSITDRLAESDHPLTGALMKMVHGRLRSEK